MEEEAGSAPGSYRNSMMSKIRSYRRDFDQLKKDLVRLFCLTFVSSDCLELKCKQVRM